MPRQGRRLAGSLLAVAAAIEIAASLWVLLFGPFELRVAGVPILARNAAKPFVVAVLLASVGIALLEPLWGLAARIRLARTSCRVACAAVLLSIVPLTAPIFLPGFLVGHDGGVHQTYAFLFNRALLQGQLPVRWVEGIADGLGQPLFNYYQVGFYYLVAAIHQCGPSLALALKLASAGPWVLGAGFMFLLCQPLGTLPAATGAAVFLWSPYLLLDAYVRTAYPEMTAIAFAPGVLWSVDRTIRTGRPIFVCVLAITTSLLLISHLPTAVIVAPVAALYVAVAGSSIVNRPAVSGVALGIAGAVLGVGLAAFYLLPAILELDAVKIRAMTAGYFDYHRHFVRPAWWFDWSWGYGGSGIGAADQLSLQIGIVQWLVLIAAVLLLLVPRIRPQPSASSRAIAAWLSVVGAALFMMTAASSRLWDMVPPLAFIQFPWRLLLLPTVACAVLAAIALSAVHHRTKQALVVVCVVALQWYATLDYRHIAWTHERGHITIDDPGWTSTDNAKQWGFRESAYDPVSTATGAHATSGRWTIAAGRGHVSASSTTDARLDLTVRALDPLTLVIHSAFVPGWRILLDGQTVFPSIRPESGYMQLDVPVGSHVVRAFFGNTALRTTADVITAISLFGCVLLVYAEGRHRRTDRSPSPYVIAREPPI